MKLNSESNSINNRVVPYQEAGKWMCRWISCPKGGLVTFVAVYRRIFSADNNLSIKVHVSADERYDLFVDGVRVGRGSENGDQNNWFYETYDLNFAKGKHTIVARTWSFGPMRPNAQVSVNSGFIFCPEGKENIELLGTGVSEWETRIIDGYGFLHDNLGSSTGPDIIIRGDRFLWGFETGAGDGWEKACVQYWGIDSSKCYHIIDDVHYMKPATLPRMKEEVIREYNIMLVEKLDSFNSESQVIRSVNNIEEERVRWERFTQGNKLKLMSHTTRRIIIDLDEYYCVYPELVISQGKGSDIKICWSETLYDDREGKKKSCRSTIEGKYILGRWDLFKPDGGNHRKFETLWWRCGRYVTIEIQTADEGLIFENMKLTETRYPMEPQSTFQCDDDRLNRIIPILLRTLQMCSHETYMDCPYYEQLMYVGDTRLQILVTYSWMLDSCLPKKAIEMFHESSLNHTYMVNCAYPSNNQKIIPSFCLWWIGMVYDYALWRDDMNFILSMMPKVRDVIDRFLIPDNEGLVKTPKGWNFYDWANDGENIQYSNNENWSFGEPIDGGQGVNSIFNLHIVYILNKMSELEEYLREPELEARWKRIADELYAAVVKQFWDEQKGMFADDLDHRYYSEHAQSLAILSGKLDADKETRVGNSLLGKPDIARASIYFSHYIFEALVQTGHVDNMIARLDPWLRLPDAGLKTTPEVFSSITRSDCHAWGAHPLYHYLTSILGIRPGSFGFKTVIIRPQLGPLHQAKGTMMHQNGEISVKYLVSGNVFKVQVLLPDGLHGTFCFHNHDVDIVPGKNVFDMYLH